MKNETKLSNNILDVFWHSESNDFPDIVQVCIMSWLAQGYEVHIWTLDNKRYWFDRKWQDVLVNYINNITFVDFEKHIAVANRDMLYSSNRPDGTPGYVTGFADWARYAIAHYNNVVNKRPCIIFDTDVILLKRLDDAFDWNKSIVLVTEESFHLENKLGGLYPVNGIYYDSSGVISSILMYKSMNILSSENEVIHGSTGPKLVYAEAINNLSLLDSYVQNNQFFEIGYDEIELIEGDLIKQTVRRLHDVTGVHLWMSMLDQVRATNSDTIVDIAKQILLNGEQVSFNSLKLFIQQAEANNQN